MRFTGPNRKQSTKNKSITINGPMNNLLNKLGFQYTGIVHVIEDEYPRKAYEKI